MNDDSPYVEEALQEYRERTWDDSDFADLPGEIQHLILARAQQLKVRCERQQAAAAA